MFGHFGQLSYCTMYPVEKKPGTAFALVHYDNPDSPSKAMTEYQVSFDTFTILPILLLENSHSLQIPSSFPSHS